MRAFVRRLLAAALGVSLLCLPAAAEEGTAERTLWIVGDSTSCDFSATDGAYYYPRYGYGTQLDKYLDGAYAVRNLAASGTSSLSFRTDKAEAYGELMAGMKAGDALLIAFGHNDEKAEAARYTDPRGDYRTEGSFAHSLYTYYVEPAQEAGVQAVLCTPIVRRRDSDAAWSDSQLHVTADSGEFPGGDYPQAIRDLGAAVNVPVVDLTELTRELYERLGAAETEKLHARQSQANPDNTHLNLYGAQVVAQMAARALQAADLELSAHVDPDAFTPDFSQVTVGPEYTDPMDRDYAPPSGSSALFADYVAGGTHFRGTAFGNLGGDPDPENHVLETDAQGRMRLAVRNNKGKITSADDGIVMYYYAIPVGGRFKLSATATLNALGEKNPNQIAFGLMARDDMYLDLNEKNVASNYVAAGTFASGSTNCFYRKGGALSEPVPLTVETVAAGESYRLEIANSSDGFVCTFGDEPSQSQGYDFDLNAIDTEYFYVGMFAARNIDVTFSDVYLEVDGQTVADTRGEGVATFADVPESHWARESISHMARLGIVNGVDAESRRFDPAALVTRASVAAMLYRLAGAPREEAPIPFLDVAPDSWYADAVAWGSRLGVVAGYDRTTFGPDATITRQELGVMLARYAQADAADPSALDGFSDAGAVADWAAEGVRWCVDTGILRGKDGGELDPEAAVSRAEAAVMLERLLENV